MLIISWTVVSYSLPVTKLPSAFAGCVTGVVGGFTGAGVTGVVAAGFGATGCCTGAGVGTAAAAAAAGGVDTAPFGYHLE